MFIDEKHRRLGTGKKLLVEAKNWFRARNLPYIELYVNERNRSGDAFWRSVGFLDFQHFLRLEI